MAVASSPASTFSPSASRDSNSTGTKTRPNTPCSSLPLLRPPATAESFVEVDQGSQLLLLGFDQLELGFQGIPPCHEDLHVVRMRRLVEQGRQLDGTLELFDLPLQPL